MARPKKKKESSYSLLLGLNGKEYIGEGGTLEETIRAVKPEYYKTKGVLTITKGEKKVTKMLNIPTMKRLFGGGGSNTQKITIGFLVSNYKFLLGDK